MSTTHTEQDVSMQAERTPADVSTLLVELGRAMRARQFYPEGHPARDELMERGWQAWQADLAAHGPLDLEVRRGAFWLASSDVAIGRGRLDELAREFVVRAVRRLRLTPDLDGPSFRALVDLLVTDGELLAQEGGGERVFYRQPRRGIQLNEVDYGVLGLSDEAALAPVPDEEAPSHAGEALASELESAAAEVAPEPDDSAPQLGELIAELDACEDALRYGELATAVAELARSLAESGRADEGYRALLALARHAGDDAKQPPAHRKAAAAAMRALATGPVLDDVIDRACGSGVETSLRATQLLLEIGAGAIAPLLEELAGAEGGERRTRLDAILLAMGELAGPELVRAMETGPSPSRRVAARLAGESQNPDAVPPLERLIEGPEATLRREAAQALVRIGNARAVEALCRALSSRRPGVPELAAQGLGSTGAPAAVRPLVAGIDRALRQGRLGFAREAIRALGRLGRPEAVPVLVALLSRGGLLQRRRLREVKLAAAAALGRLPGEQARRALEQAARLRDGRLREAAERALASHTNDATPA